MQEANRLGAGDHIENEFYREHTLWIKRDSIQETRREKNSIQEKSRRGASNGSERGLRAAKETFIMKKKRHSNSKSDLLYIRKRGLRRAKRPAV